LQEKLEKKCIKFRDFVSVLWISRQRLRNYWKYKGLAQCNYKEPANGNFGDCTKEVLANLQARNSNQRKGVSQKQDGKIFSMVDSCSSKHLKFFCFDIKYGINFRVFKFRAMFFSRVLNFAIILKSRKLVLAKISKNKVPYCYLFSRDLIFAIFAIFKKSRN